MRRVPSIGVIRRTLMVSTITAAAAVASVSEAGTVNVTGVNLNVGATVDLAERDSVIDTKTSTTVGDFEDAARANDAGEGFDATATTGVKARFGQDGFFFSTTTEFEVLDTRPPTSSSVINNRFDYQVDFTIDSAYEFDFSTQVTDDAGTGDTWGDQQGDRQLTGTTTGGDEVLFGADESGVLQPGTYSLRILQGNERISAGDPNSSTDSIEYEDAFALSAVDGGGGDPGGEPSPVPLPPAIWSGLAVLGRALNRLRKPRTA